MGTVISIKEELTARSAVLEEKLRGLNKNQVLFNVPNSKLTLENMSTDKNRTDIFLEIPHQIQQSIGRIVESIPESYQSTRTEIWERWIAIALAQAIAQTCNCLVQWWDSEELRKRLISLENSRDIFELAPKLFESSGKQSCPNFSSIKIFINIQDQNFINSLNLLVSGSISKSLQEALNKVLSMKMQIPLTIYTTQSEIVEYPTKGIAYTDYLEQQKRAKVYQIYPCKK